jgi:hypothetical protein
MKSGTIIRLFLVVATLFVVLQSITGVVAGGDPQPEEKEPFHLEKQKCLNDLTTTCGFTEID